MTSVVLRRIAAEKPWAADLNPWLDMLAARAGGRIKLVGDDGLEINPATGATVSSNNHAIDATSAAGKHLRLGNSGGGDTLIVDDALMTLTGIFNVSGGITGSPWTSPTIALAQGAAVAATVTYARAFVLGKLAVVQAQLIATAVGTAGSAVALVLPASLQSAQSGPRVPVGTFMVERVAVAVYHGVAIASTASAVVGIRHGTTVGPLGLDPNFALAIGDYVSMALAYETV